MNSRWQANKIGLINFWYYSEQEFPFVKGRMLLRGSNGSGKSVTMQSVVPLLLDGNMSPERLDPFGSRDRKMSSYLLEEEDKRDERTGYLYLEFRRLESETYITVGMGIRARKGKPLDKWYFSITDGRRIGRDFYLYKETDEKMTLTKKELENRIKDGGQVFERQAEYMEYVNRQIFGFETADEYKEMIDLLIQLRTPKLSKDFKPSVINDILSDSLQPLSDEDLRPMSEAIENMDTMSINLKTRQEGKQAAEKINRVLDKYNRLVLYEKAQNYVKNLKNMTELEKEEKDREQNIQNCERKVRELEQLHAKLDADKAAMEKEKESLNKSDAVGLKAKELELEKQIADGKELLQQKEEQLAAKQAEYAEVAADKKELEGRGYKKEQELGTILEDMEAEAGEMAFEEHTFFEGELKGAFQRSFQFDTHQKQFYKTQKEIVKGHDILREADVQQRVVEDLLIQRDKQQREADMAGRRVNELEAVLVQVQNEWKEAIYSWNGHNVELVLTGEHLKELAQFAQSYGDNSDFARVRQSVADIWIENKGRLDTRIRQNRTKLQDVRALYEEQEHQLEEWENHKEPEPFRSEGVIKNRERLKEQGIVYQELYKVLEFSGGLSKTACDRLEEALLHMGILDALVVEEAYREQLLKADKGCCDKYLFVQKQKADRSILDVLDINDSLNDIFFNQRITGLLQNIAYDGEGITAISPEGTYQIGILSGTVTGEHEAGFLGARAREQNRQSKIAACREAMAALQTERQELEKAVEELEERGQKLVREYEALPGDNDLRAAWQMLQKALTVVAQMEEAGLLLEERLKQESGALKQMKKEALQIAERLYLTCSYEVFKRAEQAARSYEQHFTQLESGHNLYLEILSSAKGLEERLDGLDADMEQIRYDAGNGDRAMKKQLAQYTSVVEQLKLTDYEEIKARLDACMGFLEAYPGELERCIEEKTRHSGQIKFLREQMELSAGRMQEAQRKSEYLGRCYEAERALAYVELPEELKEEASKVQDYLAGDCQELQKEGIIRDLNKIYFENRGLLNDYQLTLAELFEELEEQAQRGDPAVKRLDIMARYQGIKIPFHKLLFHLEEEIEDLKDLIKAGDRELFEDILANTVSRKIRGKINGSNTWVDKMNALMGAMNTSSGLKLSLRWRSRTAETEDQLDTRELVDLLKKDYRLMQEEEAAKLSLHFRSKVEEARRHAKDSGGIISFYKVMKETLDYRKWFEFQLFAQKSGEKQKELTNSVFGTFSGGEKAMSMYVPLFSAVVAKYQGGRADAPRLISLDEAFAGVDNKNIRDMFRLMTEFQFDFIINSQVLWGDCDTLDALAVYQLLRPENAKFVTVMPYLWNGRAKEMLEDEEEMEQRAAKLP